MAKFASSLRSSARRGRSVSMPAATFPMYTVPGEVLLQMNAVRSHEELLEAGDLVKYEQGSGQAMFVSHEWLSSRHPDPKAEQLTILQQALRNIVSGASQVCVPVVTEILFGRLQRPCADSMKACNLYIWYDYFCCPQGASHSSSVNRQSAIDSIPAYVAQCYFFVILCPAFQHFDQDRTLSQSSWARRGWCRCERGARELAAREDGFIIVIESAMHQTLVWLGNRMLEAPGEGDFTLEMDRRRVGRMMIRMIWAKLLYHLEQADFHNYRFLLNTQKARFFRSLDEPPIDGLVPSSNTEVDPFAEPDKFLMDRWGLPRGCLVRVLIRREPFSLWGLYLSVPYCRNPRFLHQNGFRDFSERDAGG